MSESNTRAEIVKIMAEAYVRADLEGPGRSKPPEAYVQRVAPSLYPGMDAALTALEASGRAVVDRDRMIDFFAEIDAAIVSVQGALRHYKQPQDVHFHMALKACRDGTDMLRPALPPSKE